MKVNVPDLGSRHATPLPGRDRAGGCHTRACSSDGPDAGADTNSAATTELTAPADDRSADTTTARNDTAGTDTPPSDPTQAPPSNRCAPATDTTEPITLKIWHGLDVFMGSNSAVRLQYDSGIFVAPWECTGGATPDALADLLPVIEHTYTVHGTAGRARTT